MLNQKCTEKKEVNTVKEENPKDLRRIKNDGINILGKSQKGKGKNIHWKNNRFSNVYFQLNTHITILKK